MSVHDIKGLEEQIYSKRREVRYDMRDLTVEYISNKYKDGVDYSNTDEDERKILDIQRNVLFVPDYQRDFTWDEKRCSKLVESILLGLPIPFIFVAENSDGAWEIVDGSQRIRAIHAFVSNQISLSGLESLSKANGIKFDDLDKSRKGKFLDTALRFIILSEETTDDVKKDMFERINRGSDLLKPMEKRKGIYTGSFTAFIYNYVEENQKFLDLVKVDKWLEHRQERQELLLRFFALSDNENYKHGISSSVSNFLDKYLEEKNKQLSKMSVDEVENYLAGYRQRIDSVNEVVERYFPFGYRNKYNPQTKRSVFEAISVGVCLALAKGRISENLSKEVIEKKLNSSDFKKNTHVANQLHKKDKLRGRVDYVKNMLLGD